MTGKNTSGSPVRAPLTELEGRIMAAIWTGGPSSVEAVHQAVSRNHKLKETSVRTMLRRLEQKGYLRHEVQDRAFIYRAVEPARGLAARAVRQIIDRLCQGSVEELVTGMVDAKVLSNRELDQLVQFVEMRRREQKGK
ncbi:MAG TPA: BlaI/MecI/CopY family transcriptional regulator [Bryobacteraceae bacterium]|jgi:BlaI family penicillinase repressor|nr:BlaI/MecI/CopY family transcriptional regulator [Bryobacteraceae bacterium]